MAIEQISRIQHRRGNAEDLPEALSEGELGYSVDTGELFIGAPTLDKVQYRRAGATTVNGIYPYSNVKILTEFDISYALTETTYYHGPLIKAIISNNIIPFDNGAITYTGSTISSGIITFDDVFLKDQSYGKPYEVTINGDIISNTGIIFSNKSLKLDLGVLNLTLNENDIIQGSYFQANEVFSSPITQFDSFILDYSSNTDEAYPATGYQPNKPRRVGTLKVVADPQSISALDDFTELHGPMFLVLGARIEQRNNGQENVPYVVLTATNYGNSSIHIVFSGKQWSSNI